MVKHLGSRIKSLVDNNYKGTKKEFAEAIGFEQPNNLFKMFLKEDLNTSLLRKVSEVLGISILDIISENEIASILAEPKEDYGKQPEIIKTLKKTIKAQEIAIEAMQVTINILQKPDAPKMTYIKKK